MSVVKVAVGDFVIFEGIAKNGKNAGKPYSFIKLDRNFANNKTFVEQLKTLGARVIGGSATQAGPASTLEVE